MIVDAQQKANGCKKKLYGLISTLTQLKSENRKIVSYINKICYISYTSDFGKWNREVFAFDTESNRIMDPIDLS